MRKRIKIVFILFIVLSNVFFVSCDRNKVYEGFEEIPDNIWDNKQKINFVFEIDDTLALHNVYIHIRHASNYQYKNIWLFVKSSAPNGLVQIDTLECNLADDLGKWYGKGGDILNLQMPWKMNVRFAHKGKYSVEYEQAMRMEQLPGITQMGLRVEKVDAK